jgi:dolichol-phosphate mannosyltransferase
MNKILLVIPVYNEVNSIKESVTTLVEAFPDMNMLFIDDGSTDGSTEILDELSARNLNIFCESSERNHGYGHACRLGAKWAFDRGYEWVIFADSDLTNPPNEIKKMILLLNLNFDLIKGNRFWSVEATKEVEFGRRVKSHLFRTVSFVGFRFKIKDPANGFRAVRVSKYSKLPLVANDFSLILEENYWQLRHEWKIGNLNTYLKSRKQNQRKSLFSYSFSQICRSCKWPIKYFFGY